MFHIIEGDRDASRRLVVEIRGVPLAIVNAIRRTILAELPSVAASTEQQGDITIHKNTSAMHNEMLAHRLSLIPIHLTMDEVLDWEPADATFGIHVKNTGTDNLLVTSKDITILKGSDSLNASYRDRMFPADAITGDHVVLTMLKPNLRDPASGGEELHLEFKARRDIGRTHARFCPASTCVSTLVVDEAEVARQHAALQSELSEGLANGQLTERELAAAENRFQTITRLRCFHKDPQTGQPDRFLLTIESESTTVPAGRLLREALNTLIVRVATAGGRQLEDVKLQDGLHVATLDDEDHTLGHLLQALIFEAMDELGCKYVGYHVPHPLVRQVKLAVELAHSGDEDGDAPSSSASFPEFFEAAMSHVTRQLQRVRDAWHAQQQQPQEEKKTAKKPAAAKKPKDNKNEIADLNAAQEAASTEVAAKKKAAPASKNKTSAKNDTETVDKAVAAVTGEEGQAAASDGQQEAVEAAGEDGQASPTVEQPKKKTAKRKAATKKAKAEDEVANQGEQEGAEKEVTKDDGAKKTSSSAAKKTKKSGEEAAA